MARLDVFAKFALAAWLWLIDNVDVPPWSFKLSDKPCVHVLVAGRVVGRVTPNRSIRLILGPLGACVRLL